MTADSPEHFRQEVRAFCAEMLPADIAVRVHAGLPLERGHYMRWQDILARKGWLVGAWPQEHGGAGWSAAEAYLFHDETTRAGAPWLIPMGVNYAGPVIFTFGSEAQKARHLPAIARNEAFWCQGYSEPGAGSDLARLRTRAVRDGDHYVVTGQKIWTTMAHWADWMFCLVRTDPDAKPQAGISFLLIEMSSPGIEVRPIRSIEGTHHLNEVFLDDVRVPVENLVGEQNKGWTYAKFLLGHERILSAETGKARRFLERLQRIAGERGLAQDPRFRERLARFRIDLDALEWMTLRLLSQAMEGAAPGIEASILKVRGSELLQGIADYTTDILGLDAMAYDPEVLHSRTEGLLHEGVLHEFLAQRAPTIWGGTNEIQRNLIARQALGL